MAFSETELEATTRAYWEPGAQDNYYKGNVAFNMMLKDAKTWDGGKQIRQVLDYGQPLGSDFNATSTFNTNKVETMTAAYWTPGLYYEPVTFDVDDEIINSGVAQQVDIVNTKLTKAQKHIRSKMADDFYTSSSYGASGRKMVGLPGMISTSATYGGIAVADMPEWIAGYTSSTAAPITFDIIDAGLSGCLVGDEPGDEPNLLITTNTLFSAIRSLTLPHLRLEHGTMADMGFKNIDYMGNPVVRDYKCPSGYFFWLNKNYMGFRVHKDMNFKRSPWQRSINQYLFTCQIFCAVQMICKRRDAHGMRSALTA